jgi:hypothetical protein
MKSGAPKALAFRHLPRRCTGMLCNGPDRCGRSCIVAVSTDSFRSRRSPVWATVGNWRGPNKVALATDYTVQATADHSRASLYGASHCGALPCFTLGPLRTSLEETYLPRPLQAELGAVVRIARIVQSEGKIWQALTIKIKRKGAGR